MENTDVKAPLRYLVRGDAKPIYIASEGGADAALRIGAQFEEHDVVIHDARKLATPPDLDVQGFCLQSHPTGIDDFYDLQGIRQEYESLLCQLVLSVTGAQDAIVFDHTLRSDSRAVRGARTTREPASVIHNDYTDASALQRLRDVLPQTEARERARGRFAIVNVWRSIKGPVLSSPLACCDAATLSPADLVASERRARDRIGELELVCWNPAHSWYYFPRMDRDEALMIKTFDSSADGRARRSIHSAFDNPQAPRDASPRESIESRLLVFFPQAA